MRVEIFEKVPVDSGIILIADVDFFRQYKSYEFDEKLGQFILLSNGDYDVSWKIKNTCNGNVGGNGKLKVTSQNVIVSDPCYHIKDKDVWDEILNDTYYFKSVEGAVVLDKMGGDGRYDVQVVFTKLNS
jgi:hypothetical protein